jgi:hypothetical protein
MIRWSTPVELAFHVGALWHVAYLADPLGPFLGAAGTVGLVLVPFLVLLFVRHGEFSDETVARAHLLAALWYLALTLAVAALALAGRRPPGWPVYLAFMAPGALISLWLLRERLRDPPAPSLPVC